MCREKEAFVEDSNMLWIDDQIDTHVGPINCSGYEPIYQGNGDGRFIQCVFCGEENAIDDLDLSDHNQMSFTCEQCEIHQDFCVLVDDFDEFVERWREVPDEELEQFLSTIETEVI